MGKYNSSLTRVVPLIDQLREHHNFPNNLIKTINGDYMINENPFEIRYGIKEIAIMPSKSLLIYLINNLSVLNKAALGKDDGTEKYKKRKQLFDLDADVRSDALSLINIDKTCKNKWYVFEGYTHPDIYIETKNYVIIGEAKRIEKTFTTKTKWLNERDQLIRHIDSVIDSGKQILSFLLIDENLIGTEDYKTWLRNYKNKEYYKKNLPHRSKKEIDIAFDSYIGFATWQKFQNKYGIEYIDTI